MVNYFEQASATHPRRNSVLRVDGTITSKISAYFRWNSDYDTSNVLYDGVQFSSDHGGILGTSGISPIEHPNGGRGYLGSVTYTISPTMVNEFTFANNWDQYTYVARLDNYKSEDRSLIPGLPVAVSVPGPYPEPVAVADQRLASNLLPTFSFGGTPSNAMSYSRVGSVAGAGQYRQPDLVLQDNFTRSWTLTRSRAGVYLEYNDKVAAGGRNYIGAFSFASSSSTPWVNTNDGEVNALLGNVNSYSQYNNSTTLT